MFELRRDELQLDRLEKGLKKRKAQKRKKRSIRVVLAQDEVKKSTEFSSRHLGIEVTDSNLVYK